MIDSRPDTSTIDPPGAGAQAVDFIVIGGGIAGASAAYFLAPHGRVVLLERESQPGYHSTGRSAAMFIASYGNAQVRALTRASLAFLTHPPQSFAEAPLLTARGALWVADTAQVPQLAELAEELAQSGSKARPLTPEQALAMVPALRLEAVAAALYEPDAFDIDVHALHQGFLKGFRRAGGQAVCGAEVRALERKGACWTVTTTAGRWCAPVVLNAAGAWADQVAALAGVRPIGLVPKRRSAFVFAPPDGAAFEHWPLVVSAGEDWYFKPDAGALLGSPANADPTTAQDVQPEELDIALGVHRLNEVTTLDIRRPQRPWAGLRSFVADGGLVGGFDRQAPGFFWVAAQGGYGVQTAPAMGEACAALARGLSLPAHIAAEGLTEDELGPARLARHDHRAAA
jgi:D-arginine dehydrogenase